MWAQPIQVQKEQIGVRACSNDFSASQQISPEPSFKATHMDDHGQTPILWRCQTRTCAEPGSLAGQGSEQPGRKQPFSISKA